MITQKTNEAKKMQIETGNHISYCADQIVEKMSDAEIIEFSNEIGTRRAKSTAERAVTGIHNRTGEKLTERSQKEDRRSISQLISTHIQSVVAGRI